MRVSKRLRISRRRFALHTIARELRVARHILVFLEKLGGVSTLPVILAIAWLSSEILAPRPASAPASALSIIDQNLLPQSSRKLPPLLFRQPAARVQLVSFHSGAGHQNEWPIASGVGRAAQLNFGESGPAPENRM